MISFNIWCSKKTAVERVTPQKDTDGPRYNGTRFVAEVVVI
jgi:hypothetical protein